MAEKNICEADDSPMEVEVPESETPKDTPKETPMETPGEAEATFQDDEAKQHVADQTTSIYIMSMCSKCCYVEVGTGRNGQAIPTLVLNAKQGFFDPQSRDEKHDGRAFSIQETFVKKTDKVRRLVRQAKVFVNEHLGKTDDIAAHAWCNASKHRSVACTELFCQLFNSLEVFKGCGYYHSSLRNHGHGHKWCQECNRGATPDRMAVKSALLEHLLPLWRDCEVRVRIGIGEPTLWQ
ncbi:unnamed protein product [Prorocentrum cordatum]|uniref:Uncharacterized protein n=1 Tax=Prorocentrum cordatum TaxID=2364126 RepID=A0ABN9UNF8_9DINO|nr:unnamed protein product [Polarella glacialis]CAK0860896.1 unnamed protein product [Polarella glacialis]